MRAYSRIDQKLPASGPRREALRERGQFWTPDWIADAMVTYVVGAGATHVFDPAVGAGAFLKAAKRASAARQNLALLGVEIDPSVLSQALETGLSSDDLANVQVRDFLTDPPNGPFQAIVANPPYIRHHRLSKELKGHLRGLAARLLGTPLDGRAGVHVYFLIQALRLLAPEGRLAFIMPADTCEGVFSTKLWTWITSNYRLDVVVTFAPEASPFPGVDTNPIIFAIRNAQPTDTFYWLRCTNPTSRALKDCITSDFQGATVDGLIIQRRQIREGLFTGLSRGAREGNEEGPSLGDFALVMRGIATGANDFFFLTRKQTTDLGIPSEFLLPAVGRTRDVQANTITAETLRQLDIAGRPTLLFAPDGRPIDRFPHPIRAYLRHGEAIGLNKRPLIATRRPWYKMEVRPGPPFLFAYLGRRSTRFIRNLSRVTPLTGFLCVYPHRTDAEFLAKLWELLQHPDTIKNLGLVGKSYGDGAIKVEPRALERLPLPKKLLADLGLKPINVPRLLWDALSDSLIWEQEKRGAQE